MLFSCSKYVCCLVKFQKPHTNLDWTENMVNVKTPSIYHQKYFNAAMKHNKKKKQLYDPYGSQRCPGAFNREETAEDEAVQRVQRYVYIYQVIWQTLSKARFTTINMDKSLLSACCKSMAGRSMRRHICRALKSCSNCWINCRSKARTPRTPRNQWCGSEAICVIYCIFARR